MDSLLCLCVRAAFPLFFCFFFFNDTATTEIYTLSLHDALPISARPGDRRDGGVQRDLRPSARRSEEHTSELQSPCNIVCRLLLEKKKKNHYTYIIYKKKKSIENITTHN